MNLGDFDWEKWVTYPPLAAAVGSVIAASRAEQVKWISRFANFCVGIFFALVVAVAMADFLHVESKRIFALLVFTMGLGSVLLCNIFLEWLKTAKLENLPVIGGWFRKQGETP